MAEPTRISLAVEVDEVPFNPDESHYAAYAYLHILNYRFTLQRVGDYVEDGVICHESIDEDVLEDFRTRFQAVADALGVPLVIEPSFRVPEEPDEPQ